jgi:hypothetical protein
MALLSLDRHSLCACLADLAPVQLQGMKLLREAQHPHQYAPGEWFPRMNGLTRDQIRDAVVELVAYSERCARAAQRLAQVNAIPLTACAAAEWVL